MPSPPQGKRLSFVWTENSSLILLELCVEFRAKHGHNKAYKWPGIVAAFEKRVDKGVDKAILQSRLGVMKREYELWKTLKKSALGLGSNPVTGQMVAKQNQGKKRIQEVLQGYPSCFRKLDGTGKRNPARSGTPLVKTSNGDNVGGEDEDLEGMDQNFDPVTGKLDIYALLDLACSNKAPLVDFTPMEFKDVFTIVGRVTDAGMFDRTSSMFRFVVDELLSSESMRRLFMCLRSDSERKCWLAYKFDQKEKRLQKPVQFAC